MTKMRNRQSNIDEKEMINSCIICPLRTTLYPFLMKKPYNGLTRKKSKKIIIRSIWAFALGLIVLPPLFYRMTMGDMYSHGRFIPEANPHEVHQYILGLSIIAAAIISHWLIAFHCYRHHHILGSTGCNKTKKMLLICTYVLGIAGFILIVSLGRA